jgi:DNA-binding transcriptional MocR family regulator
VQQNVSIATVMQAYRLLENRGLIEARPQSGYYVRPSRWSAPPEPAMYRPASRAVKVCVSDLVLQVVKAGRDPKLVKFGATLPSPELFPLQALNRTMAAVSRRSPMAAHSYDVPPGLAALRVQVARRAMEAGCTLAPEDIITTVGATEALNLCLRAVTKPGDIVAIESPTFFGILQIIESLGLRVCEIPTNPREGICLEELADRLKCCNIKACLFTLNYSNPLGSCMPDEKKQKLVELLTEYEIPLIEDDIYGSLTFEPQRPKTAKAFDQKGWVMLCDSFTKTLSPGYRVGWVAPGRFAPRIEFLKFVNTSATASLPQMAIAEFLQNGGYDHHLRKLRRFYAAQMQRMSEAIVKYFPPGTKATRPSGGMCVWVELPETSRCPGRAPAGARCRHQHRARPALFRQTKIPKLHPPQLRQPMVGCYRGGTGEAGQDHWVGGYSPSRAGSVAESFTLSLAVQIVAGGRIFSCSSLLAVPKQSVGGSSCSIWFLLDWLRFAARPHGPRPVSGRSGPEEAECLESLALYRARSCCGPGRAAVRRRLRSPSFTRPDADGSKGDLPFSPVPLRAKTAHAALCNPHSNHSFLAAKNFSTSIAAAHPIPAAVTAWR